jgi:small subunit ribosomal protein S13
MKKLLYKKFIISKNGVGSNSFQKMYNIIGLNPKKHNINIKIKHKKRISFLYKRISYSKTLKSKIRRSVGFYFKVRNYRGVRHIHHLPVRGKRTHTNAKTRKKHEKKKQSDKDSKKPEKEIQENKNTKKK